MILSWWEKNKNAGNVNTTILFCVLHHQMDAELHDIHSGEEE